MATGPSTTIAPYLIPTGTGVLATSILTVGDTAPGGTYKMAGLPDGLGAYDNGDGTFTVLMNHEIGNTLGVAHGPLTAGAFVSQWVIKKSDLSVVSGGDLIKTVFNWDTLTQKSNAIAVTGIAFNRFCSADLPSVSAFYNSVTGLGTAERIFMNGEESGGTGSAVASVSTGANKGNAYILGKFDLNTNGSSTTKTSAVQLNVATASTTSTAVTVTGAAPRELAVGAQLLGQTVTDISALTAGVTTVTLSGNANATITAATPTNFTLAGVGGWENLVANPFAQDKTVVIGDNDGGTGIMNNSVAVYVGTKTKTGTEADKAGLTNGVTKFVNVTGNPAEIVNTTTRATNIVDGTKFTLSDTSSTAFSRPEDGAWNPSNPNQYFFVTTDRIDTVADGIGTQIGRSRLWRLNFADITNPDAGGTIDMLLDGTEGQVMFDNLTVDRYGHITLLEDVGNAQHNGKVWQYDIATDKMTQLLKSDPARFGDVVPGVGGAASTITAPTAPFTIDEETSGVIDVQDILGAGWSLIDVQAHYTNTDPALVEGGQLLAIYNPVTAASAAAPAKGKIAFSGVAAGDATTSSEMLWTRTIDAATKQGITSNLTVQVSTDASFATIAKSYTGLTDANRDYTLKVDATGLTSGTKYFYRFQTGGGDTSAVGTFKTAIDPTKAAAVRFGFSGDYDGLMRPYPSTADFGKLNLDFFANIGDTIYENASKSSVAAADPAVSITQAVVDYRAKYLENLQPTTAGGFASLQTFFASQGNYTALDNHELGNKQLINGGAPASLALLAGNGTNNTTLDVNTTGTFINQTAGFKTLEQVYLDYQPVREKIISAPTDARTNGTVQLYNANQWGKNVVYINTDTRSYRDVRLKTSDANGVVTTTDDTGARADNPNRTLLGKTQLAWLKQNLLDAQNNGTTWKFVSVTDPIDQIGALGSGLDGGKSWVGGYRAERNELLKYIADNGIKNVVFLSADDHQNRINEITYLDNINDPTSVRVLANAMSIVDGPIGATGPDTVTDHSFANIKKLADSLAANQSATGVNPIGLSANFAGLKNVVREGDPTADTNRQAVDFYSPDTFNYTTFDISADGKTLNVNVQGVNSYLKDTNPEPSAANPVRSILSFSVDASVAPAAAVRNDFNGDGKSEILWRNTDGSVATWSMNGSTPTAGGIGALPAGWTIAGTGDFSGDKNADILLTNTDGRVSTWQVSGSTVAAAKQIGTLGAGWSIAGTGDFNGDGTSDVLVSNTDGRVANWQMNASAVVAAKSVGTLGAGWSISGTGDFNGDGTSDLLLVNTDGSIAEWQISAASVISAKSVGKLAAGSSIAGIGDFNGDGKSDLLFRNTNGSVAQWLMNGETVTAANTIGTAAAEWKIAGTGDFNGDKNADILWRNDGGSVGTWQMNGSTVIAGGGLTANPMVSTSWQIATPVV